MTFHIRLETLEDDYSINEIIKNAFGPGRFAKTAYRLREAPDYKPLFGLVTENHLNKIVATVRIARLKGYDDTVILGPIAVDAQLRNMGLGLSLMQYAEAHEYAIVLLLLSLIAMIVIKWASSKNDSVC